jgi:hypothetical protein
MRSLFYFLVFLSFFRLNSQVPVLQISKNSMLYNLQVNDSVTFYQCHVEDAVSQLITVSGQTVTGKKQKYTITEKFVISKVSNGYLLSYYTTVLSVFPNRKFSGLKIQERSYWNFNRINSQSISEQQLAVFLALEKKGREPTEYDFAITKYTTNQIIIKQRKDFKQLVIEGNYFISKLLGLRKDPS